MQSRGRQAAGGRIRRTGDGNALVLLSVAYPTARPEPHFSSLTRLRRNPAVIRLGGKSASCVYEEGAELVKNGGGE